jgi:general secretion pathway protein A
VYVKHYGLQREPFSVTPDPGFLYLTPQHREALAAVMYGVESRQGFVVLTGEVGTGKTTVLRAYLAQMNPQQVRVIYLFDPNLSVRELLQRVLHELGRDVTGKRSVSWLMHWLHWTLIREYRAGRNVALIIDEAQHMSVEMLEQLRLLSNLETGEEKLVQLVLVGQPELDTILQRRELRQLRQRVAVRAGLRPLSRRESLAYVRHRVALAGGTVEGLFTRGGLRALVRLARGVPRTINILGNNALLAGYGLDRRPVPAWVVRAAERDLTGRRNWRRALRWGMALGVVLLALGIGLTLGLAEWWNFRERTPDDPGLGYAAAYGPRVRVPHAVRERMSETLDLVTLGEPLPMTPVRSLNIDDLAAFPLGDVASELEGVFLPEEPTDGNR